MFRNRKRIGGGLAVLVLTLMGALWFGGPWGGPLRPVAAVTVKKVVDENPVEAPPLDKEGRNAGLPSPEELFTEEELAYIAQGNRLKVGYVQDRKPISFRDENGELGGVSRLIFNRLSDISGLQFDYVGLPGGSVTYDILQGEGFDLVTSVEYNKENQKARGILMSDPYLSSKKVIVAREGLTFDSEGTFTVAVSTGSQTLKKVLSEQFPNFTIVDYNTIEACFDAVSAGETDLLIQNQYVVEYWLYKPHYENLKVIPVIGLDDQLCFSAVVPLEGPGSEEWSEKETVIHILDKAISCLSEDEVASFIIGATMENQYEYTNKDFLYRYRYTLAVLLLALILTVILVYAIVVLRLRSIRAQADAKAKGDFLSAMSHEIRTPLNGLVGLNYLMSQNLDDKEKMTKYLWQFSSTADYLLSLVNNILDMSRLQEERMDLDEEPLNLEHLLETVETIEMNSMEEKKIQFRVSAGISHPRILGDIVRIQQVILNMLDNARKFTPSGGSVTLSVEQTVNEEGQVVTRVSVQDTGCGISEEFQRKIFDSFTQERSTVSSGNQGTGLGMSISYLLAKQMGGDMSVTSRPGEGSCFVFTFPAWPTSKEPKEHQKYAGLVGKKRIRKPGKDGVTGGTRQATGDSVRVDMAAVSGSDGSSEAVRVASAGAVSGGAGTDKDTTAGAMVQAVSAGLGADKATAAGAIVRAASAESGTEATGAANGAGLHPIRHILIAEDNELNAQILMELLEDEGYEVTLAENGKAAVDRFAASEPGTFDLILMDVLMPEMDGFTATRAIRAMNRADAKSVLIFACTANSFKEDLDKAMESGMDDFIAKPVDVEQLLLKIAKM